MFKFVLIVFRDLENHDFKIEIQEVIFAHHCHRPVGLKPILHNRLKQCI